MNGEHPHVSDQVPQQQRMDVNNSTGSAMKSGFSGCVNPAPPNPNPSLQIDQAPKEAEAKKHEFDYIKFRYSKYLFLPLTRIEILPKVAYFSLNISFIVPLVYFNRTFLFEERGGILFAISFFAITALTFFQYLRTALADPGFINSMLFNKAYQHNNETEVSQNNMTQQDVVNPNQ